MRVKLIAYALTIYSLLLFNSSLSAYPLQNGDFSSGLAYWNYSTGVSASGGVAEISDAFNDNNFSYSFLYQSVGITPGNTYSFGFDYSPEIKTVVITDNDGTNFYYSDLFVPTLFFGQTNDVDAFTSYTDLFQLNADGFTVPPVGIVSALPNNWFHVSYSFTAGSTDLFLFPEFDLFEQTSASGDRVLISNVALADTTGPTSVPEPSAMLLLIGGFAGLGLFRRSMS